MFYQVIRCIIGGKCFERACKNSHPQVYPKYLNDYVRCVTFQFLTSVRINTKAIHRLKMKTRINIVVRVTLIVLTLQSAHGGKRKKQWAGTLVFEDYFTGNDLDKSNWQLIGNCDGKSEVGLVWLVSTQ